jgi:hypothetical protein
MLGLAGFVRSDMTVSPRPALPELYSTLIGALGIASEESKCEEW